MTPATQKVGRITVAVGLISLGAALLLDNITGAQGTTSNLLRYWPVLLIGFGAEYLVRSTIAQRKEQETKLKFDFGGAFLLLLLLMLSTGITFVRGLVSTAENGRLTFAPSISRHETATAPLGSSKELQIDVPVGRIQLQPGTADEIRVEATYTAHGFIVNQGKVQDELEKIKLKVTEGQVIRVSAETPFNLNNTTIQFLVYAPENLKVRAKTGAGTVYVTGYKGDMDLSSNAGSIVVNDSAGTLIASTGSGSFNVSNFEGSIESKSNVGSTNIRNVNGTLQLNSGTGRIEVFDFQGGKLVAETRTGTIHATTSYPIQGDVVLKTSTGSINLTAPDDSNVRATASTRTGSLQVPAFMSVARSGTSSTASGTKGDGKYTVSLEAGTGTVHYMTNQ